MRSVDGDERTAGSAPLVSIVTPFLNAAPFLEEAVESVLAQTYSHWELWLVDDGSTDGSTEIARGYARRYPEKIFYVDQPGHENRGTSAAINLGIRHARGAFLALIDGDDVWLPNKLAEQVPLLLAHPEAGMLYGNSLFWHSWTGDPSDAARDFQPPLGVAVDALSPPPDLLTRCLRREAAVPCPCSVLLRREIVERVGAFEESLRVTFSDQAFYTKMFVAAPVYVASGTWNKYRIHPTSAIAIAKRTGTLREERGRYLDFVARYLKEQNLARGAVWWAVQAERWRHRHERMYAIVARGQRGLRAVATRIRAAIPERVRPRLRRLVRPPGGVRFGNLRRITPISRDFGLERGQPIDRHYIEAFLARHARDVGGHVLEVGDDAYTRRFGGDRVGTCDVLHVSEGSGKATIVDDLASGQRLSSDTFDCIILTQTLHLIFDVRAAVCTLYRILRPGGVLLATMPGISQIHGGRWRNTWYWSFTPASARRLFAERFPIEEVQVRSHGNVLAASAFLHGLASEELSSRELALHDPLYPLIVTVRARKPPVTPDAIGRAPAGAAVGSRSQASASS
jgi:glycosyltransferase involved in cell wall biosynthesis